MCCFLFYLQSLNLKAVCLREGDMMNQKKLLSETYLLRLTLCSLCYQKCYQISWLPQTLYSLCIRDIVAVIKQFICDLHNVLVSNNCRDNRYECHQSTLTSLNCQLVLIERKVKNYSIVCPRERVIIIQNFLYFQKNLSYSICVKSAV